MGGVGVGEGEEVEEEEEEVVEVVGGGEVGEGANDDTVPGVLGERRSQHHHVHQLHRNPLGHRFSKACDETFVG